MKWYGNQVKRARFTVYQLQSEEEFSGSKPITNYWSAIFFSATIYTTIGYGTVVPITAMGKIATMVYSMFGIPLVFIILNELGDLIARKLIVAWEYLRQVRCRGHSVLEHALGNQENAPTRDRLHTLPMTVALGLTLAWMLLCTALFCTWETEWTYFTSFYFFFVSLTTIGLGDTVPQVSYHYYRQWNTYGKINDAYFFSTLTLTFGVLH